MALLMSATDNSATRRTASGTLSSSPIDLIPHVH